MSLDRHLSVMMKKTQMSSDSAGSQCGLTSLLPMSCRGRAAAFARDLNSRLRNLGTAHGDDGESSWLARTNNTAHRQNATTQSDLDQFYTYDIASPPSPVNEYDPTFAESLPTNKQEQPFNDVESNLDIKEQTKIMLQQPDRKRNGFEFSTAFYDKSSPRPVKLQPTKSSDNRHADRLYSPITFEDCLRQDSHDETDNVASPSSADPDLINLSIPAHLSNTLDSDSEFESAKSDPSEGIDEMPHIVKQSTEDVTEVAENLSLSGIDISVEEESPTEISEDVEKTDEENVEIVFAETPAEVELLVETETSWSKDENKPDDQDEDDRPQRVRRCSSLKTGKTPPGTPGRKKMVRFADVLGLDLTDIKTFMDDVPVVPKSAYKDLAGNDILGSSPPTRAPQRLGALTLVPLFQLPRDCTERLERLNVCLEIARVCDGVHVSICGSVRVRNLDFHKTVHIRYTMNSWKTYTDLQTNYVQGSCDGYSDRFQFTLYTPCITKGQRLELAVRFQCKGQQFWDNNKGVNYCFDCLALGAVLPPPSQSGPLHPTTDSHPSFC